MTGPTSAERERGDRTRSGDLARRLLLASASLLLVLALVEVGLRAAGFVVGELQRAENMASLRAGAELVVLCIGESTTALGGANAYPRQLEEELRRRRPNLALSVVNGGTPRVATDRLLRDLPEQIARYQPHVVVTMMGINDDKWYADGGFGTGWLEGLRVATLIGLGLEHLRARLLGPGDAPSPEAAPPWDPIRLESDAMQAVSGLIAAGEADAALEAVRAALERDAADLAHTALLDALVGRVPAREIEAVRAAAAATLRARLAADGDDGDARVALAYAHVMAGEPESARALLEAGPAVPDGAQAMLLGRLAVMAERASRARRWDDAVRALQAGRGIAETAGSPSLGLDAQLAHVYERTGRDEEARTLREGIRAAHERSAPARTRSNYRALRDELARRGIEHVAVQYPMRPVGPLRAMLGGGPDVVVVDNEASFREAVRERGYWRVFSDQFAGDFGHLTRGGNALLARNVADALDPIIERMRPRHEEPARR